MLTTLREHLNDATQKNLSLSANINIWGIAWISCFKQELFEI